MLIAGPRTLNTLEEFTLTIKEKELDRVHSYKYLGLKYAVKIDSKYKNTFSSNPCRFERETGLKY